MGVSAGDQSREGDRSLTVTASIPLPHLCFGPGLGSFPILPPFLFSPAALPLAPSLRRSPVNVVLSLSLPTRGGEDQLLWPWNVN